MWLIVLAMLLLASGSFAQPNVIVYLGVNLPLLPDESESAYGYWSPGINAVIKSALPIENQFQFEPSISYQHLFFNREGGFISPDNFLLGQTAKPSQVLQVIADLRFVGSSKVVAPSVLLGVGYQWIKYGTVTSTWSDLNGGSYPTDHTRRPMNSVFLEYGAGVAVQALEPLIIEATIKSINSFENRDTGGSSEPQESRVLTDWVVGLGIGYGIW